MSKKRGKHYFFLAIIIVAVTLSSIGMHQANMAKNVSRYIFEAAHKHNWFWSDGWFVLLLQLSQQAAADTSDQRLSDLTESFRASKEMTDCFSSLRNPREEGTAANLVRIFGISEKTAKQIIWTTQNYSGIFWEIPAMMDATDHGSIYSRQIIELLSQNNWYEHHQDFRIIYDNMKEKEKLYSDLSYKISKKTDRLHLLFFCVFCFSISTFFLFIIRNNHLRSQRKLKNANLILQDKENSLQRAQAIAKIGSWELNLEKDIYTFSAEICRILEIDPANQSSSIWKIMEQAIHPADRLSLTTRVKELRYAESVEKLTLRIINKNGEVRWIEVMPPEIKETTTDGKPLSMIGTVQDITELKYMEGQLRQALKMEAIGRLAGGIAHDFNNMLSIILGYTELMLEDVDPEDPIISRLGEIHKAANRSADLTRQLLAFASKQTIDPKMIDLNNTIEGMLKMLGRLIGENIELSWQPEANLWPIKMDPSQVDQMLANLCVNARDAISGIGEVTIETGNATFDEIYCQSHDGFTPGDYTMIAVSDNGSGMNEETLENIFEPFFTSKSMGEGTGLGLSTVYGIVKQNDGLINVNSEPGLGTTFRIYLPRQKAKSVQVQHPKLTEKDLRGDEAILLVEDEKSILTITAESLERLGYRVFSTSSPTEAIRIGKSCPDEIDLLITDVIMPEMNGQDLASRLELFHPSLKCLFMSGYTANVIAHHGVLDEGIHFINKPFSKQDLAIKVRAAIVGDEGPTQK